MRYLPLFLFAALLFWGDTQNALADDASDFWVAQCQGRWGGDDYGRRTPYLYIGRAQELVQINEPFTIQVRGGLTKHAPLSFSDSGVSAPANKKSCLDGTPYNESTGCPHLKPAAPGGSNITVRADGCYIASPLNRYSATTTNCGSIYQYTQEVTITGTPRDVVVKVEDGGAGWVGDGGNQSKPYCQKIQVYREPQTYEYWIEVDKSNFGSEEAFKVTLESENNSLTWLLANQINGMVEWTRSNASMQSCENSRFRNLNGGFTCEGDSVLECSLLPDTSKPQYLCAVTALDRTTTNDRFPNRTDDVTYTIYGRTTFDLFDKYVFTGSPKNIVLYKEGTNQNGGMTSYMGCPTGQGVDPDNPGAGCTRCQNINHKYARHITSCLDTIETNPYVWQSRAYSMFDYGAPSCPTGIQDGQSCSAAPWTVGSICRVGQQAAYDCIDKNRLTYTRYYGWVVDGSGAGIPGVRVTPRHITAAYLGVNCSAVVATTDASGRYEFDNSQSQSLCLGLVGANVDFKKDGYQDAFAGVGSQFDKFIATTTMHRVTGSTSTPPGTLAFTDCGSDTQHCTKTFQNGSATFTIANASAGQIDACYQVINHPNDSSLNTPESTPCSTWATNWTADNNANAEWDFNANGTLTGVFAGSDWNIPGLKVRSSFRKSGTNEVITATLVVPGSSTGESGTTGTSGVVGDILGGVGSVTETVIDSVGSLFRRLFGGLINLF